MKKINPFSLGPSFDNEFLDPKFLPLIYLPPRYISLLLDWGSDLFSVLVILHLNPIKIHILLYCMFQEADSVRIASQRFFSSGFQLSQWMLPADKRMRGEKGEIFPLYFLLASVFYIWLHSSTSTALASPPELKFLLGSVNTTSSLWSLNRMGDNTLLLMLIKKNHISHCLYP